MAHFLLQHFSGSIEKSRHPVNGSESRVKYLPDSAFSCGFGYVFPRSYCTYRSTKQTTRYPAWLFQWDCAFYEEAKQLARKVQRRGVKSDRGYTHHYAWTRGYDEAYGRRSTHGILPHEVPPPKLKWCTCAEENEAWRVASKKKRLEIVMRHLKRRLTEL